MKKKYKNIIIAIVFLVLVSAIGYIGSNMHKKSIKAISKDKNNEKISIKQDKKNNVPKSSLLSEIVIYNSHSDEAYSSGMKVTDVSATISDKLIKEGLKSSIMKCNKPKDYDKSYDVIRDAIRKNIKNYSDKILLDVQRERDDNPKSDKKKMILFILANGNPHYKENKKFVDVLMKKLEKSKKVKVGIYEYHKGMSYFNQDLSDKSVLIELGNNMSSDDDVNECVNELVLALKNI